MYVNILKCYIHDFSIWLIIWQNFKQKSSSFRISNAVFHYLWALCCYWEIWGASDSWYFVTFSLEAHRICILPFWKLLSFILGVDDFFTSGLLFQYSFFFFFWRIFLYFLRHSDFFLISVIFLISTNSIPMPLKKKKIASCCSFHLLLPFWGYYWEVSFFFLVSSGQCLFPPYSFFCCSFYII